MRHTILLVDDDSLSLMATQALLQRKGYGVDAADDSETAVRKLAETPSLYSLVLLDYQLGNVDGASVAKRMLEIKPDLYILMYSGDSSRAAVTSSWQAGAVGFLEKDARVESFLAEIGKWCRKRESLALPCSLDLGKKSQAITTLNFDAIPLRLLDVSLRDGGYRNGFSFDLDTARKTVVELSESGVDIIEIGYRKGSLKGDAGLGLTGKCSDEYLAFVRAAAPSAKLAVMVHPHNITFQDLETLARIGIDWIRICVNAKELDKSLAYIRESRRRGLSVSANLTRISSYTPDQVQTFSKACEQAGASVIYFADSNGSLLPEEVDAITTNLREVVSIPIGFHAHNNLSLALPNALAALNAGATFIDGSLGGMGKGAGNLGTEVFATYLTKKGIQRFNLVRLLEYGELWEQRYRENGSRITPMEILAGAAGLSADVISSLSDTAKKEIRSWHRVAYEFWMKSRTSNRKNKIDIGFPR